MFPGMQLNSMDNVYVSWDAPIGIDNVHVGQFHPMFMKRRDAKHTE